MAVLEILGPEGIITASVGLLVFGVREWRLVQVAREQRRVREYQLLAQMIVEVADDGHGMACRYVV
ncbi:hypothetical protein [Streptomyces pseudogriseolus]|uniref:hypothetical protein n=1 Tax=Streptomyces pseudogriseolus TaxID=36817 RepID=UPI003FA31514